MGRRVTNAVIKIAVVVAIGAAIAFTAAMFAGGAGEAADDTTGPEIEITVQEAVITEESEPETELEPMELKAEPEPETESEEEPEVEKEPEPAQAEGPEDESEPETEEDLDPAEDPNPVQKPEEPEDEEIATPIPWTDADVDMLAKLMYAEAGGVHDKKQQAAIAWCVLNRLDAGGFGDTIAEVITAPEQFAWHTNMVTTDAMRELAEDVLNRWWAEKNGTTDVGRVLPSGYLYFDGDGVTNHFHTDWQVKSEWDWSLPDPYSEGG